MPWFALALAGPALAGPDTDEARSCLDAQLSDLWQEGVRSRSIETATLKAGETHTTEHLLFGGFEVTFRSCAGAGATNLDLLLVDDSGKVLFRDDAKSRDPALTVTPTSTGRYRLVAYLRGAKSAEQAVPVAVALTFAARD
ncbi:MAG: hypothetical protein AAF211_16770 [Myxococcota bacterium]